MAETPHRRGSFNYRTINDTVKRILDVRSVLDNTIQVAMPFVKATTTLQLPSVLGQNAVGFTLGVHANQRDFEIQDIYADRSGNALIGYTYERNASGVISTKNIYANLPQLAEKATTFLDGENQLYSDENRFAFIPPPGITNVTVGTNRAGLTRVIEIDFQVPTLPQLEVLHRTFLVPGIGMVLEWGQQFAPKPGSVFGESGITSDTKYFPWYNHDELLPFLKRLGRKEVGMDEILNNYVYPSQGQYMWLFGKVANFTTKANSDGSYDCTVKLLGQGEDSWAYLTRTTMVRPTGKIAPLCLGDVNSVEAYFTKTSAGNNFKTLLEAMDDDSGDPAKSKGLGDWVGHVKKFEKNSKKEGEGILDSLFKPNTSESTFGEAEDAYFMTWRFFVNVVLNNEQYGLKSIFNDAGLTPSELDKVSILRPYTNTRGPDTAYYIADPYENFVGNNQYLRSVDLGTLIIVNEKAVENASGSAELKRLRGDIDDLHPETDEAVFFRQQGDFYESTKNAILPAGETAVSGDKGFLSTGVWINHKAVIESFVSANTILQGINNLLNRMNNATLNFWDLTIDVSEPVTDDEVNVSVDGFSSVGGIGIEYGPVTAPSPPPPRLLAAPTQNTPLPFFSPEARQAILNPPPRTRGTIKTNYVIVDANYRESSDYATQKFLENVHTFNKYIRSRDGTLLGSDVIDCNVTLDLPKRLFGQIATVGLVQPKDIAEAGGTGDSDLDDIVGSPALAGADELLRNMFAITSIAVSGDLEQSPDLTEEPKAIREQRIKNAICATTDSQLTAEAAGEGHSANFYIARSFRTESGTGLFGFGGAALISSPERQLEELSKRLERCNENCIETPQRSQVRSENRPQQEFNRRLTELTIDEIIQYQSERAMFAVGKYQLIPNTFKGWVEANNITGDTIFNRETQELAGNYLLEGKRPKVGRYVRGDKSVSIEDAHLQLAQEFASIPVPFNLNNDRGTFINAGESYYKDRANNRASHTVQEVRSALLQAREQGTLDPLKVFISKGEGNPDSINIIPNVGDRFITPRIGEADYLRAINGYTYSRNAGDFPPEGLVPERETEDIAYNTEDECVTCQQDKEDYQIIKRQIDEREETNRIQERVETLSVREYPHLRTVFRYVEPFGEWMVSKIANEGNGNNSNPFGAAPGSLSIKADITLPGIAGLRVGELFWIDRIPSFYRAFGAFQILSIEENVSMDGWTTKIHGVFNYLGTQWKKSMTNVLREGISQ